MSKEPAKNTPKENLTQGLIDEAMRQVAFFVGSSEDSSAPSQKAKCTEEERIQCALKYGPQAIDNKILVSISENINTMAEAINESEKQKNNSRRNFVIFFEFLLLVLIIFAGVLIVADTFWGYHVRTEFLISVIIAIVADVLAIVHTLVKYMTNVEHYEAYNKLIDSLLKRVNHGNNQDESL